MTERQNILSKFHVLHVPYRQLIPKRTTNTAYYPIIIKIHLLSKSSVFRLFVNSLQVLQRNDVLSTLEEVSPMENSSSQNTLICPCQMYTLLK